MLGGAWALSGKESEGMSEGRGGEEREATTKMLRKRS